MKALVRAMPRDHVKWFIQRTQYEPGPDFRGIESVDSDGRILGIVGFDQWTYTAVHMHAAIESPSKALLLAAFEYGFGDGREMVCGWTPADNVRACRLARHLGFSEVYRLPGGWRTGVDLILHRMTRAECRWLERRARKAA